ncbi:MAG: hypothetical protein EPO23_12985 [Xanthobacteraceae bacterium]|nr:MAG: hypothetical protein EPO23_12985 [Xanthobacteraceae bacterium]
MTTARQERKDRRQRTARPVPRRAVCLVLSWLMAVAVLAGAGGAAAQVVTNRLTGLALDGFDPVSYFIGPPASGEGRHEALHDGAVWRFRNEGNRLAFLANPGVYAPRFGGYDAVELARGRLIAGHSQIWLLAGGRLHLFYDERNRADFAAATAAILAEADRRWPGLQRDLPDAQ